MTYKKYEVTHSVKLNNYPKYDAYILDNPQNIRQNHWTMKCRSQWPTNSMKSVSVRQNKNPKYDAFLFDRVGNTRQKHWTMKYRSQWPIRNVRVTCSVNCTYTQSMMLIYYMEPETQGKITGPWNMGHSDLQIVWGHWQCQTKQVSKV